MLKRATESTVASIQEQAISTKYIKKLLKNMLKVCSNGKYLDFLYSLKKKTF